MARAATNSHRMQLEKMAVTWEQLAEARRRDLHKRGLPPDEESPTP
ncbi:MAG: hypothetical protein QOF09_1689 [Alphaproteobacteria bacterium]|jgi:hypothetical protein|nr:hypothetical protein [Alphaproteobacteria bacterium]